MSKRALPPDATAPETVEWTGKFVEVRRHGKWEFAGRPGGIRAAVILALDAGQVLLVEQYRVPLGKVCLEMPAGLIGDETEGEAVLDGAARDAARAGSLQGERSAADRAALEAATNDLQGICEGAVHMTTDGTNWTAQGGHYAVQLSCTVRGLAVVGLSIPTTMSSQFAAPLDPYRRYE